MIGSLLSAVRRYSLIAAAFAAIQVAAPVNAQRGLVIDIPSQSNTLSTCGINCYGLTLGPLGFTIDATGSITVGGPINATFFPASSTTPFQVLSGYTFSTTGVRTDFVDFYQLGRSTAPITQNGNRPAPDFQIQLTYLPGFGLTPNLEIAFAYAGSTGVNNIPLGASIGYRGPIGVEPAPGLPYGSSGGYQTERFVTNTDGLLLGQRAGDSVFVFVVGPMLDRNYRNVFGLVSQTFDDNYAISAVPEPATWATMLLGFGVVGASLRFRRRRRTTVAAA